MSDNSVTKWLRRLFNVNTLGLILAAIGLVFTYLQFVREEGGKLSLTVNGEKETAYNSSKLLTICTADENVDLAALDVLPEFRNDSRYAVRNLLLTGEMTVSQTISIYVDNEWKYSIGDGKVSLKYKDNTVYPHTNVPIPVYEAVVRDDGMILLSCEATFEGSEQKIGYLYRIKFISIPAAGNESFSEWKERAKKQTQAVGDGTVIYCGMGYSEVADNSGSDIDSNKKDTTEYFIEDLEDVDFDISDDYTGASLKATFKAPGVSGKAIAVFSGLEGQDTVPLSLLKLFTVSDYTRRPTPVILPLNASQTEYTRKVNFWATNNKFIGFAKENPDMYEKMICFGDSIRNESDKSAIAFLSYDVLDDSGKSDKWLSAYYLEPHETISIDYVTSMTDSEILLECYEAPHKKFSDRNPILYYVYIVIAVLIFLCCCVWIGFAFDEDEPVPKISCIIPAVILVIIILFIFNIDVIL